jgi:hypothetical protein
LVSELSNGDAISLPFVGKTISFSADSGNTMELGKALDAIKTLKASSGSARLSAKAYADEMERMLQNPRGPGPAPPEATRLATGSTAIADLIPGTAVPGVASAIAGLRQVESATAGRNADRRRETAVAGLRQVEAETAARNLERVEAPPAMRRAARQPKGNTRIGFIPESGELAGMSKKDLIREANSAQVATYGTKGDIIARIEQKRQEIEA